MSTATETLADLRELTRQLAEAAKSRDSALIEQLAERFQTCSSTLLSQPFTAADSPDAVAVAQLAEEILQLQGEIQALSGPWMDEIRQLLRNSNQGRALNAAYR